MALDQKDLDKLETVRTKAKDLIDEQAGKALVDIETYAVLASGRHYAPQECVEKAISISRAAKDEVLEAKSGAIIKIDNIIRDAQSRAADD